MASWFIPLRPCCVNIQEVLLFPFVKIRFGIEGKCCKVVMCSENDPFVLLLLCGPKPKHGEESVSPLFLLLLLTLLPIERQQPICLTPKCRHPKKIRWTSPFARQIFKFWTKENGQPAKRLSNLKRFSHGIATSAIQTSM